MVMIDGQGLFLMPALADMHVHMIPTDDAVRDLMLFLANGVTTIRIMWGNSKYLEWREKVAAGEVPGPRIFCASPGMDGPPNYWPTAPITTAVLV